MKYKKFMEKCEYWKRNYEKVNLISNPKALSNAPEKCKHCNGSNQNIVFVYLEKKSWHCIMWFCLECGFCEMLQMPKNANARTNTNLSKWSVAVKRRDNETCCLCGKTNDLNAHHIVPVSVDRSKMYDINNGICLCKSCHDMIHKYMKRVEEIQNG